MKIPTLLILLLTIATSQARLVTLFLPEWDGVNESTNQLAIAANESVEVVSYHQDGLASRFDFFKNGRFFHIPFIAPTAPDTHFRSIFVGPVIVQMSGRGPSFLTLKIELESFPPDKTVVIPQGGGASISMECSTNLIDWIPAAPGVYTNQPAAKFFRIKPERVP